jgi:transcriptional regulator with PAS, ATPase and Fis domain
VKGAFTGAFREREGRFEAAHTGDIFLDEVGDLPLSTQIKLLRVLEEKVIERVGDHRPIPVDVRIITATNRDLAALVDRGAFRRDLYYRVNVIRLVMPPLRDRPADVPLLVDLILRRLSMTRGKVVHALSREAMRRLMRHDFPGNVRELENILEHAHVLSRGRVIEVEDLPEWLQAGPQAGLPDHPSSLRELEAAFLRGVLARNAWHRAAAACELGIHVTTLRRRICRLGLELPPTDGRAARRPAIGEH